MQFTMDACTKSRSADSQPKVLSTFFPSRALPDPLELAQCPQPRVGGGDRGTPPSSLRLPGPDVDLSPGEEFPWGNETVGQSAREGADK